MNRLNPDRVFVEYRDVTPVTPVTGRKYTQTHSDITAELFVTIGLEYARDKMNPMRDEVLAEWYCPDNNQCYLWAYVYVGGYDFGITTVRYNIFMREIPLSLAAIRYADTPFFVKYPGLDRAPIYVYFDSTYPAYRGYRYFGTLSNYKNYYRAFGKV